MLFCFAADNCWAPPSHEDDWHDILGQWFLFKLFFSITVNRNVRTRYFFPQPLLFCVCPSLLLDNERWKQAEVPAEFQDLVDSVSDGRISLPEKKPTGVSCSPAVKWIYYLQILLLNVDGHILMTRWICVCSLFFGGMGRKLIAILLSFFFFFCYWCWNILCWKIICLFFGNTRRVSTGRELPFIQIFPV